MNRHFAKEQRKMAGKYIERCSISLAIRKMRVEVTGSDLCTPDGEAVKHGVPCTAGEHTAWVDHFGKRLDGSSQG